MRLATGDLSGTGAHDTNPALMPACAACPMRSGLERCGLRCGAQYVVQLQPLAISAVVERADAHVAAAFATEVGQSLRLHHEVVLRHLQRFDAVQLQAHADDAGRFKGTPDEALARYFIGHYNPLGNHFCAFAMKDRLVEMLDPKPAAYAR